SISEDEIWLPKFLHENAMVDSTSDGRRMIKQGAVKVDGEKVSEEKLKVTGDVVIQVGKRKFLRVRKG
ncbi:MAG: S4 domain-containing protein, partial [Syntrophomonas sp.]